MNEALDKEVAAALESAGLNIKQSYFISAVKSPSRRRKAYRIDLQTGRTIKARLLEDEETAQRLFEFRRDLPHSFAPVLAQYGAVLLERWVQGDVLQDRLLTKDLIGRAAVLLAELHETNSVAGRPVKEMRRTMIWRERMESDLGEIVSAGELDRSQALVIRDTLNRTDPKNSLFGLVHTDFCGENMVIDRDGQLHIVDNERISIDSLSYDFARSWYRWALPNSLWAHFKCVYAAHFAHKEPFETFDFWRVVAIIQSAALRLRVDRNWANTPLVRLRCMAAEISMQQTHGRQTEEASG